MINHSRRGNILAGFFAGILLIFILGLAFLAAKKSKEAVAAAAERTVIEPVELYVRDYGTLRLITLPTGERVLFGLNSGMILLPSATKAIEAP